MWAFQGEGKWKTRLDLRRNVQKCPDNTNVGRSPSKRIWLTYLLPDRFNRIGENVVLEMAIAPRYYAFMGYRDNENHTDGLAGIGLNVSRLWLPGTQHFL
jgi:hypothetical protein